MLEKGRTLKSVAIDFSEFSQRALFLVMNFKEVGRYVNLSFSAARINSSLAYALSRGKNFVCCPSQFSRLALIAGRGHIPL